jgi:hypothetical protein
MRVLAVSLLANLVLLVALALRPALAPPAVREFLVRRFHFGTALTAKPSRDVEALAAVADGLPPSAATQAALLGAAFATDDFTTLTARMRAAGFPAGVIAEIARREIDARYEARVNALTLLDPNTPFWKTSPDAIAAASRRSVQISQLFQEREKAYRDAVNDPFFFQDSALDIGQRRMWGDLPRAKLDRIQRIEDDYADMMSATRSAANGVLLAEDREKLDLLEREKQADIAALLSPEEVAEYKLRTGSNGVASRLRLFNPSEAEYRVIAQAQIDVMTRLSSASVTPDQRREATQAFDTQIKAALGEARYAEYVVTTNPEFQQLSQMADADRLPASTTRQAFGLRDQVGRESGGIFDDPALDPAQKRAALQTLAQNTRNQLLALLGPTSGPAYVKIADSWLNNVGNGSAVSFNMGSPFSGTIPTYRRLPGLGPATPVGGGSGGGVFIRSP